MIIMKAACIILWLCGTIAGIQGEYEVAMLSWAAPAGFAGGYCVAELLGEF